MPLAGAPHAKEVADDLPVSLHRLGVAVLQLGVRDLNWEDPIAAAQELATRKGRKGDKLLVIIDEALKGEMGQKLRQLGVLLLNAAHMNNIRFVFIDALFLGDAAEDSTQSERVKLSCHKSLEAVHQPVQSPLLIRIHSQAS